MLVFSESQLFYQVRFSTKKIFPFFLQRLTEPYSFYAESESEVSFLRNYFFKFQLPFFTKTFLERLTEG